MWIISDHLVVAINFIIVAFEGGLFGSLLFGFRLRFFISFSLALGFFVLVGDCRLEVVLIRDL
jgi:hypothetical protein